MNDADLLDLQKMLKALGDVARLEIVAALASTEEMTVTDLGHMLTANGHLLSQPLVSWHISVLRRWGLICTRRVGRLVYCSLDRTRYDYCLRRLAELVQTPGVPQQMAGATAAADPAAGMPR